MKIFNFFLILLILKFFEYFEIFGKFRTFKQKFIFYFRILKIGKPRQKRVLIFPDRQTSGSVGINTRC